MRGMIANVASALKSTHNIIPCLTRTSLTLAVSISSANALYYDWLGIGAEKERL
jgi:hypothetical protein